MESDPTSVLLLLVFASIILFFALSFCAFKLFCQNSEGNEYSSLGSDLLGSHSNNVPREFLNDEESLLNLAESFDFTNLSPEEQSAYLKGQEFTTTNPPDFGNVRGKTFTTEDEKLIKECGISAFQFELDQDVLNQRFIVADKTELNFNNNDMPYSTATSVLNYPLPVKNRVYSDTVYFETKVFEFNNDNHPNAHFSIGLVTKPYPSGFRLPGYNKFSIGYESTGNLKINKPFPTPLQQHQGEHSEYNALVLPPLQQADIVGFGYVISTGTIFITRNGKKLLDVMKGCFVDLFPAVGCFSTNAKFQVNLGQLGFVWIEANVRKYGFVSTSDYKKISGDRGLAALPQYDKAIVDGGDKVLDKGDELPPQYPEDELDFFGRAAHDSVQIGSSSQHIKLSEKNENGEHELGDEAKEPIEGSSTQVTNEPEEIMDLRERIYEQTIQNEVSSIDESTPLIAQPEDSEGYNSTDKSRNDSKDEPVTSEINEGVDVSRPVEESAQDEENLIDFQEEEVAPVEEVSPVEESITAEEPQTNNDRNQIIETAIFTESNAIPPTDDSTNVHDTEPSKEATPASPNKASDEEQSSPEPSPLHNDSADSAKDENQAAKDGSSATKPNAKKKKKKSGKKGGKKKGKKK
ncbi:SSH4 Protein SSH4 [Candida maltosa Xu316]